MGDGVAKMETPAFMTLLVNARQSTFQHSRGRIHQRQIVDLPGLRASLARLSF